MPEKSRLPGRLLLFVLPAIYPLLVYVLLESGGVRLLAPVLLVLGLFLLLVRRYGKVRQVFSGGPLLMMIVGAVAWFLGNLAPVLYYPVMMNIVMLSVFAGSLFRGMPVIERIARLREPDLPESGVSYTRKVTVAWCVFFIVNGSISLATVLGGDLYIWTLYNGLASYILMAIMVVGEMLIRRKVRKI